jgi:hypothetical protein
MRKGQGFLCNVIFRVRIIDELVKIQVPKSKTQIPKGIVEQALILRFGFLILEFK